MNGEIIVPTQEALRQIWNKDIYSLPLQTNLNRTEYCTWYMENYFNTTQVLLIVCLVIILIYMTLVIIHIKYDITPKQVLQKLKEGL